MIKLKASLEAVKTRKNVTDDVIQTITLNIYTTADQIGALNELYRQPLEITLEVSE